ncbi:UNVERIFIED_CONTAM: hypothetical protein GTU68_022757 [Idotea baltica]|nr:hypothetical protein [Idotea baltica]
MEWITTPCGLRDERFKDHAIERQSQLTKPAGSLGALEDIAVRLADCLQTEKPQIININIAVFAADHGVAAEGVSAFPQEVTTQMVANFLQGGAAISVLAKQLNAQLGLTIHPLGKGTANSANEAAMTQQQLNDALNAGKKIIEKANSHKAHVFIGGEMGIGNTTTASALYCALLGLSPEETTGAGTGLDETAISHKTEIIKRILATHEHCGDNTLEWLRCAGGFEVVALTGAYINAAQSGLPILVDGFISSVAALAAVKINPSVNDYLFFSHLSAEQGHKKVLQLLKQKPLLDLGLRLGEGSGAAIAVTLLQSACNLHNEMATFEEAAVASANN